MDPLILQPGPRPRTVREPNDSIRKVPSDWVLLPPGDATLTRRVKKAGEAWCIQQRKGRRVFSLGIWAPKTTIENTLEPRYKFENHANGVKLPQSSRQEQPGAARSRQEPPGAVILCASGAKLTKKISILCGSGACGCSHSHVESTRVCQMCTTPPLNRQDLVGC